MNSLHTNKTYNITLNHIKEDICNTTNNKNKIQLKPKKKKKEFPKEDTHITVS